MCQFKELLSPTLKHCQHCAKYWKYPQGSTQVCSHLRCWSYEGLFVTVWNHYSKWQKIGCNEVASVSVWTHLLHNNQIKFKVLCLFIVKKRVSVYFLVKLDATAPSAPTQFIEVFRTQNCMNDTCQRHASHLRIFQLLAILAVCHTTGMTAKTTKKYVYVKKSSVLIIKSSKSS